ncbi:MAG: PAS domain S-box protein [Proteobacteria bacterium]|nr:PAS domain S-box protein [Pseudomonadota bacterium]
MKTLFEGKKLYAVIIVFLLIITFSITFEITRNHYQYVLKNTFAENTLKGRFLSSLMYEYQKAAIGILQSYAQRPLFIDTVKKKDFHRAISHLKSLSEHHTEIDTLFITDQSGTVWANYPVSKESYGKNLAYRDWYKGVSKKWRPYISTVFRLIVLEKDLTVAVSVPVFDRKGEVIGILGSTQRTHFLAAFLKENIIDPKKNIALLDQEGNIIFSNTIPYEEKITKYPDARVLEKALAGVIIDMEIADAKEKGSISYVSIAPVRGIGWSVIVGQKKNAILKSLYRYFILSAVAGFVIFLLLTVSLLYFRKEYRYRKTKELLQAEVALRESEERYRNILESIEEGYYEVDIAGNFTFFNDSICELLGYSKYELKGMNNRQYTDEENAKTLYRAFSKVYTTGKPTKEFDWEVIRKDGTTRFIEASVSLIRDSEDTPIGFRGIVRDITQRKRAEEERERLLAEIAAKNQELESFVYTISHDLRAPLVSMDGFYSLLKRESQDQLGEQGRHYLERIRANVAHMNTLVTELLELSRIGRVVGPEEEIDVGALLREIEEGLALKLEQEGVEFIVQQPLPAVRGDRGRIRQVFANLIENAVKFRSLERGLRIEVGCEEESGFYRFHVRDNGIGILPQYQEQIFEPFRQLDRGIEGVGMGLALVKRIVAYHRGRFWVESELGKGSTFYFTIPDRTNDDVRSAKYDRRLTRKRREPMKGESK